jgi:hypothetical protein
MERLSAEYLTLATLAQEGRWDTLVARSGLTDAEFGAVRSSEVRGPLFAAFREAEARGLDIEATFPRLVAGRSLADAADVAAVLHGRVERWAQAAGGGAGSPTISSPGSYPEPKESATPRWPVPWPSVTRPWKIVPARWPNKQSSPETPGCNLSVLLRATRAGGPAGCATSRQSRPTGIAGTSPGRAASGAKTTSGAPNR